MSLLINYTQEQTKTTTISFVSFIIDSKTIAYSLLRIVSASSSSSSSRVSLDSVEFQFKVVLNAPLISMNRLALFNFTNISVTKVPQPLEMGEGMSNADDSICGVRPTSPGLLLMGSSGTISKSSFMGISTGAILIDGGGVVLEDVSFTSNFITRLTNFPGLRHNMFVSNGAEVNFTSIKVDTGESNFVYVSDDNSGSVINGLDVPLFVPSLLSSHSSGITSPGDFTTTTIVLLGSSLYPCGRLTLTLYKDIPSNIIAQQINVMVADESTATVSIPSSLLEEKGGGKYYVYLVYGAGYETEAVEILKEGKGDSSSSDNKTNVVGLVVGIIIAVVAVIAVIVVVVVFLVWRHNEIKKRTTESAAEHEKGAQSTTLRIIEAEDDVEVDDQMNEYPSKEKSDGDEWYVGDHGGSSSSASGVKSKHESSSVHISSSEDDTTLEHDVF